MNKASKQFNETIKKADEIIDVIKKIDTSSCKLIHSTSDESHNLWYIPSYNSYFIENTKTHERFSACLKNATMTDTQMIIEFEKIMIEKEI